MNLANLLHLRSILKHLWKLKELASQAKPIMRTALLLFVISLNLYCNFSSENLLSANTEVPVIKSFVIHPKVFDDASWQHFLQNLPTKDGPVLFYNGEKVDDQSKSWKLIDYSVGRRDLQQCADAIMRIRAEYLFSKNEKDKISFHFTSGHAFSFKEYCKGARPVISGNHVDFRYSAGSYNMDHASLLKYLDIVYAYAGTISLEKELKSGHKLETGTVVVKGGSPGHCFIIINEGEDADGNKYFMLAEGYSPAQSIYILKNEASPELGPWHMLKEGEPVYTASYDFVRYKMGVFE